MNRQPVRVLLALACAALAPVALAQTYTVNVEPKLNDLNVQIEPVETTGMLVMKLTNKTDQKVRCTLRYDASPQTPKRNTVYISPGETVQNSFRAQRKWFAVNVEVECEPADKKK